MEVEQELVQEQGEARQRKPKVFSSKVYLVTVGNQEVGSQSYLVRGVKTEAGAKRALLDGLTVTSKLLDSGELLDMLKAGVFPPEIVVSPEALETAEDTVSEAVETAGKQDQKTEIPTLAGEALHEVAAVPSEATTTISIAKVGQPGTGVSSPETHCWVDKNGLGMGRFSQVN